MMDAGIYQGSIYENVENELSGVVIADGYALQTLVEGHCRNHYTVPNANNNGALSMTLKTVPIGFRLRRLGCHIIQGRPLRPNCQRSNLSMASRRNK